LADYQVDAALVSWLNTFSGKSKDWERKARRHIGGMDPSSRRNLLDMSEEERCRQLEELMEVASGGSRISCLGPVWPASHFH
jgi:hypothetical protein